MTNNQIQTPSLWQQAAQTAAQQAAETEAAELQAKAEADRRQKEDERIAQGKHLSETLRQILGQEAADEILGGQDAAEPEVSHGNYIFSYHELRTVNRPKTTNINGFSLTRKWTPELQTSHRFSSLNIQKALRRDWIPSAAALGKAIAEMEQTCVDIVTAASEHKKEIAETKRREQEQQAKQDRLQQEQAAQAQAEAAERQNLLPQPEVQPALPELSYLEENTLDFLASLCEAIRHGEHLTSTQEFIWATTKYVLSRSLEY